MPMWQHRRRPTPPPPQIARTASPVELSDRLMDAIVKNDTGAARQVLDKAFWDNIEFRPDGYHLLHAVRHGSRDLIRLLTTHGARWTEKEACIACAVTGPGVWADAEGELRRAGIRTQFTGDDLKNIDAMAAVAWALRSLDENERRGGSGAVQARSDLSRILASGVTLLTARGETDKAVDLFKSASRDGDGSAARPFDVQRIVTDLAALEPGRSTLALKFLDAVGARGLAVKPLVPTGTMVWMNPELVPALEQRGLLARMEADARMNLLHNWSFVQPKIDTGAGTMELNPAFVEAQHRSLRRVAETVFRNALPATEAEAERFLSMHLARVKQSPQGLARMEKDLLELGFFDSPAFTSSQLRTMAGFLPEGEKTLSDEFYRRSCVRLVAEKGLKNLLSPAKLHEIAEAHRLRAWRADALETVTILDYLQTQAKKGPVPPAAFCALEAMRDGGADFSKIDPHKYLAKDGPGLCKTMLDLGVIDARKIKLDVLAARHGGELRPLTPPGAPDYADMEFMCQVTLETAAPEKYIPLRGDGQVSYQKLFLREYTSGRLLKRRFMTRGTGPR